MCHHRVRKRASRSILLHAGRSETALPLRSVENDLAIFAIAKSINASKTAPFFNRRKELRKGDFAFADHCEISVEPIQRILFDNRNRGTPEHDVRVAGSPDQCNQRRHIGKLP
jgi:hypothetical protein